MRNVLERIFEFISFFFVAIFSFWAMVDFVFNIRSELGLQRFLNWDGPDSETQTSDSETQKSIRGQGVESPVGGMRGEAPHKNWGLGEKKPPNINLFLNSCKSWMHYVGKT